MIFGYLPRAILVSWPEGCNSILFSSGDIMDESQKLHLNKLRSLEKKIYTKDWKKIDYYDLEVVRDTIKLLEKQWNSK